MRKFLISAALASAALSAVPALAQDYGNYGYGQRGDRYEQGDYRYGDRGAWNRDFDRRAVDSLLRQLDRVDFRIERSMRRGALAPREAFSLRREANQLRQRLAYASRDGLGGREFAGLQYRVNLLEQRLRYERRDRDGRPF